jgi:Ca-activated chloride channel family protein
MIKTHLRLLGFGLTLAAVPACGGNTDEGSSAISDDAEEQGSDGERDDADDDRDVSGEPIDDGDRPADSGVASDERDDADDEGDTDDSDDSDGSGGFSSGDDTDDDAAGDDAEPTDAPSAMMPAPNTPLAPTDPANPASSGDPAGVSVVGPGASQDEAEPEGAGALDPGATPPPIANTNVSLGGSQDFGYFRQQLDAGLIPEPGTFDAAGFFAEHHTQLPSPDCGERVCLQAMVGVMGNLLNGQNCTMLQLGLNSPIAADASQRPPLTLAVVVDTSGSMNTDGQIDFVRQGLELLIDGLKDEDRFALITYDTNSATPFPMADVSGNRVELRELVRGLEANGSTNLYDGLEDGYREVFSNYDSGRQNRVILLSDGNPTVGVTDNASIATMSEGYNSEGVGLTTIGLGTSFNYDLMRDLALRADGNFYFLESAGAVSEVFDEELSFFTVPIAFDLSLQVRSGDDYEFGRAVGSPLWENNETGGSLDVPSVFIAHRESDEDITEDGGRRGGGSALLLELMPRLRSVAEMEQGQESADIAVIDVSFREPGSDVIVEDTVVVNYPNAPWEIPAGGFFANANSENDDVSVVTKSFVMLNVFVGLEQAVAAYYENAMDPTQSIADLAALLAALDDYNEEVQDTDIEYDIALVEQMVDVMIANSVPEPTPELLSIPDDPWPAD